MNVRIAYWFALSSLLIAGNAAANEFALGAKAGTLGLGLEGTVGMSEYFNMRVGLNCPFNYTV